VPRSIAASPPDEAALVARALAGDDAAFAELVRLGAPAALGAARRITGDRMLAEDAAQEAFLRAFRALKNYRHESSFAAWVRRIAARTAIDLMRRRRPEESLVSDPASGSSEEKRLEDLDLLRLALASLPPLDREILLAREVEGEPDKEIARRLEMTVTGVRVRMHRARKRLQMQFQRTSK
jgi:RNA polymerase sigma-70 factor (ECF subfamily)